MAQPAIQLRPYSPADFETLYRIDQSCFPKDIAYGRAEMHAFLRSHASHCLLAEFSREIAGFILTTLNAEIGHIITIDVLEAYRRHRVGSLLLKTIEREAASQGVQFMIFETAISNKPALAFWQRHGYRQFGMISNYYGRGLDAYRMHKLIAAQRNGSPAQNCRDAET